MANPQVTFGVRRLTDTTGAIDIGGEVSAFAETALMNAYNQVTAAGGRVVLLNFGGMSYMNSSGIGLLVTLLIRANRQKQRLVGVALSDHYRHIFELTRLNEAIPVYATEAEALASPQVADARV
jgi:anti-sigma B factor antagonist